MGLSGRGHLLVSGQGELVILEKGSDFDGDMLTVAVADGYRKEFGRHSLNYYGWFELTEANYDTEVIAEYRFGLNGLGREKFRKIADKTVFPAVTRVKDERSPAYYFSGDFNDYVARARFPRFLFAEAFYRTFSYDREGDITNFYWNFYYPLMKTILKQTEENRPNVVQPEANAAASFRITDNRFERLENGEWVSFTLKGFNIQGVMPAVSRGNTPGTARFTGNISAELPKWAETACGYTTGCRRNSIGRFPNITGATPRIRSVSCRALFRRIR